MENYKFRVIIEQDEDGMFVATVPELKGCHTQAKTLDTLIKRTKEAVELYLDYQKDTANLGRMSFVGLQEIEVRA
ncbi:MAG: type II toxin-antitoxin system HicB family antitoxin [Candidatus Thermoplasmatota archaeon]|nr:type II toxin-antitoxin system HicB family antitoxin [Euryarchaeota archaeon]MBU4031506.1 type II toxin-antitoxin system HicB family antitoxin [Candidatus Thermoplasmatota archaeon]MBU4070873.1 type II toxin-antitoxin system HicB family antitoxin [Candidatus Thermoplasmatota archaeon]MBU4143573.1 type II toxin-antitoxin system HicB family antitoxin [Candidatus Thermoplasmatota archaeon]MBU4591760.1 type II toxin-antitoxin system HicB family antitoxin [Candidatus Thermoplasmatota archaeon]